MARQWCNTSLTFDKCTFIWTIDHFSLTSESDDEKLLSSTFSAATNDEVKWRLCIHPNWKNADNQAYLSVYLILVESDKPKVRAEFDFILLNNKQEEFAKSSTNKPYEFIVGTTWGFKMLALRKEVLDDEKGVLTDDKLTLFCEVRSFSERINVPGQTTLIEIPSCQLVRDLERLFLSHSHADIVLKVGNETLQVHRAILAARSTVFAAMFEEHDSVYEIDNVEFRVLKEMLRFIYTGNVPFIGLKNIDLAFKLLRAANIYELDVLKAKCELVLFGTLSIENAASIFVFADTHKAHELKKHSIKFINSNASAVSETAGWKDMVISSPHLLVEAFQDLVARSRPLRSMRLRNAIANQ